MGCADGFIVMFCCRSIFCFCSITDISYKYYIKNINIDDLYSFGSTQFFLVTSNSVIFFSTEIFGFRRSLSCVFWLQSIRILFFVLSYNLEGLDLNRSPDRSRPWRCLMYFDAYQCNTERLKQARPGL